MRDSSNHPLYRLLLTVFLLVITFTFVKCKKWTQGKNDTEISKHGDDEGHKKGQNCMNCHYTEGQGDGWFSVGGSVYGSVGDGTVYLYKDWASPAIDSIEIDADGNLYTTEPIDFVDGLHVSIKSGDGTEQHMTGKIFNGQCNLCHGVTEDRISF